MEREQRTRRKTQPADTALARIADAQLELWQCDGTGFARTSDRITDVAFVGATVEVFAVPTFGEANRRDERDAWCAYLGGRATAATAATHPSGDRGRLRGGGAGITGDQDHAARVGADGGADGFRVNDLDIRRGGRGSAALEGGYPIPRAIPGIATRGGTVTQGCCGAVCGDGAAAEKLMQMAHPGHSGHHNRVKGTGQCGRAGDAEGLPEGTALDGSWRECRRARGAELGGRAEREGGSTTGDEEGFPCKRSHCERFLSVLANTSRVQDRPREARERSGDLVKIRSSCGEGSGFVTDATKFDAIRRNEVLLSPQHCWTPSTPSHRTAAYGIRVSNGTAVDFCMGGDG